MFDAEDGPLAGLRCLELCWVWSGPMVCQILADLGAEVIKVETPKRFDLYRTRGLETQRGLMDERTRIESSIYFHSLNRNKIGLSLDLKQEEGLSIAKSLIGDSDLVIENFTVGTMERLGLSRDVLAEANSRIVQLSMSGPGRGSAVEELRSYGLVLSALGGAEILIEEEGQFLGSPTFSLSDPNAAVFGAMAAIAGALSARENGRGMAIDLSQIEAAATLGTAPVPSSSTRDAMVETADGAIVATSVPNDSPAEALDFAEMTRDQLVRNCEIVGGQTAVFRELDQSEDATEFADCSAWLPSHHSYTGDEMLVAAPWRESGARAAVRKPAPLLGEGDRYVLGDLLSFSEAEIVRLTESGIVGVPDLAQPAPPKRKKANV
ncbi:MAG: CaiB/BaiF CoA-transferase family protein [Rhodospirillaceae bacterium]|nr:CaiB/BaiF CoA-transferase family protein [Rhodospirillaceae bacterium]